MKSKYETAADAIYEHILNRIDFLLDVDAESDWPLTADIAYGGVVELNELLAILHSLFPTKYRPCYRTYGEAKEDN